MNYIKNLPAHVGIIMDGNGRWATKRHLPRLVGHRQGVEAVKRTINACIDFGIKILTIFAFSTENWKRDKQEIDGIFDIIREYVDTTIQEYKDKNIKVVFMGELDKLPQDLVEKLKDCVAKTQNNTGLTLNLAINYGARDELVRAVNNLLASNKKSITEQDLIKNLYSYPLCDPDLIIRTSGEMRLSNFMLFQSAYSELYFAKVFWPSFNKHHLKKALKNYSKRERRYGGNHKKGEI